MTDDLVNNGLSGNLNNIETAIWKAVSDYASAYHAKYPNGGQGNTMITKALLQEIGKVGIANKYTVKSKEHKKEWLFDMVWYRANERHKITEFNLALESELSQSAEWGLQEDFDKLLTTNAQYRIFICFAKPRVENPECVNTRISFFNEIFATCTTLPKGSRILALIWDDNNTGIVYPHLMVK